MTIKVIHITKKKDKIIKKVIKDTLISKKTINGENKK